VQQGSRLAAALATCLLILAGGLAGAAAAGAGMRFGMDPAAIQPLARFGAKPGYAMYWAGAWNERAGFGYLGSLADSIADQSIQPVVQWYYWGGDISPSCVSDGCWGGGVWKSRANWWSDAYRLADALHGGLRGRPGVLVLESEFNKNGIEDWEPFDGILASHARVFRERAPELRLVLGFGNWQPWTWWRFDQAAGASDMVGFQTMRGSTRDSEARYLGVVDAILAATVALHATFGKPVLLHDLALSSYWEPQYAHDQERVVRALFARMGDLRAAGLVGVVYRALDDDPDFTLAEYYGVGERWMGLRHPMGGWKPALDDWLAGVRAASATGGLGATFQPKAQGNDWWVEVKVTAWQPLERVDARVDGGWWVQLAKQDWGAYAKSFYVHDGAGVQFRAVGWDGSTATSGTYTWW
jgi:hypothetical protein